jgi:RHS repeat-associated protein
MYIYPFPFYEIINGDIVKYYFINGKIIARKDGRYSGKNMLLYYHPDHVGTPNILTNSVGEVVSRIDYFPFGTIRNEKGLPNIAGERRFTGKELDSSGLYYFGARFYDPKIGKFITPDPFNALLRELNMGSSQKLNLFSYVLNNPMKFIDPIGLQEVDHDFGKVPGEGFIYDEESGQWADPVSRSYSLGAEKLLEWTGSSGRRFTEQTFLTSGRTMAPIAGASAFSSGLSIGFAAAPAVSFLVSSMSGGLVLTGAIGASNAFRIGYYGKLVGLSILGYQVPVLRRSVGCAPPVGCQPPQLSSGLSKRPLQFKRWQQSVSILQEQLWEILPRNFKKIRERKWLRAGYLDAWHVKKAANYLKKRGRFPKELESLLYDVELFLKYYW